MPTIRQLANAVRLLSIDAIQKANSGHPGMPMGMADIATVLWKEFLHHNPTNPHWINRDRFILSNGHGSMLQYSLLHLTGYQVLIKDLQQFRQLHSITPGHPECGDTPGIETTTGPLGQGLANAVGMALAEKMLAAKFNQPNYNIIDHYTYVFAGDGCMMEGISHETCALAAIHGLGKLILFWDNNGISIDGYTKGWFTEDTAQRFSAYGWHVVKDVDGHNPDSLRQALLEAKAVYNRPSLICCKTTIGFGSPNLCDSGRCHGAPLGDQEIELVRKTLDWPYPPFMIPDEIYQAWDARKDGQKLEAQWQELFANYQREYPELAAELLRRTAGELPKNWQQQSEDYLQKLCAKNTDAIATRKASQNSLNTFGPLLPELFGGSADLTESNLTDWHGCKDFTNDDATGNYLHYGVREFGMFAILNGIALHGGFIPYGGTFLVFASYGHSALRMASMMKKRVIYVLSHDSIGLGEDGPTHQPIEQLTMLRATPNLSVWRPCDPVETAVAWQAAIERTTGPTVLVLTRQKVAPVVHDQKTLANCKRGGYILLDCDGSPDHILIATGSEVEIAVKVHQKLTAQGKKVRVVSMPSIDVFDAQDRAYQDMVLPPQVTSRIAIEAGATCCWYKYVGSKGKVVGIDRYGASAPAKDLFEFFGLTEQNIVRIVES